MHGVSTIARQGARALRRAADAGGQAHRAARRNQAPHADAERPRRPRPRTRTPRHCRRPGAQALGAARWRTSCAATPPRARVAPTASTSRSSRSWAAEQGLGPAELGAEAVRRYVAQLSERGAAPPAPRARKLAALRALFSSQREHGADRPEPRRSRLDAAARVAPAARAERARGGGACSTHPRRSGPLELRDRAIFELAYSCGLRAEELVSLRVDDVDHDGEQLRVEGKGRKTRFVPVGEPAMAALRDYLDRGAAGAGRAAAARRRRRGAASERAVPEPKPGARLGTSDVRRRLRTGPHASRGDRAARRLAARAAPQLRDPSARRRRRPAQHPGAARPRERVQHPDLHSGRVRQASKRLRAQLTLGPETGGGKPWRRTSNRSSCANSGGATRRTATSAVRERLVVAYSPLVKYVAGRTAAGLPPHVEEADLISYGLVGLISRDRALRPLARHQVRDVRDHAHQGRDHRRAALDGLGAAQRARARAGGRAREREAREPAAARADRPGDRRRDGDHASTNSTTRCWRSRTPRSSRWTSCGACRTPAATRSR